MTHWFSVARVGDIADRGCRVVNVNDTEVAVYNLGGTYYAIEDCCNHDGGDLSGGWVEDDVAVCPRHLARFSIRTGAVLAGPAYESVHSFPTRVHDGEIQIGDDRN
ncbi:MAG: Rieske (2Fe-2S) protein [Gammaproteobacteria bacterium]